MKRTINLLRGLLAGITLLAAGAVQAQPYPNKPIRLIVPFPAGGTADFAARTIAGALQQGLGQQVIVDNRAGADGVVASQAVLQAAPDGYTLYFATTTGLNAAPVLHKPSPYDPLTAFTPIAKAGFFGFFLMSHDSVPARTAQELMAHARANPGKLSYGTGNGTSILTTAQLAAAEKVDMAHIPYKGDAPAGLDFIAGRIQLMIATPTPAIQAQIKEGKLRVLATLLPNRSPLYPQTPTATEAGLKGMTITPWAGLFGPAGLPREVVERVSREMRSVAQRKDIRDTLDGIAYELDGSGPAEMTTLLADQLQVWRRGVQELGLNRN
ncbi:MAG: Bug family tripartite tricarboxylate transporter substrate binding protein [Aquabacterium sp.]